MQALSACILLAAVSRCVFAIQLHAASKSSFKPTMLTSSVAKCIDGSQAGYYIEPATNSSVEDNWVIWLEGGMECADAEGCHGRLPDKSRGELGCTGSSKNWNACHPDSSSTFMKGGGRMLISAEEESNPKMFNWNRVFLPYCSSDLWSGSRTQPSDKTFGLQFSGHRILDAAVAHLRDNHKLKNAKTVIFAGESAGGIGVWLHVDWLQAKLPKANVVAAPVAGFYSVAYPYFGKGYMKPSSSLVSFTEDAWPGLIDLWSSFIPEKCKSKAKKPSLCMMSAYSRPYIDAPAFVIEAQTDSAQLMFHNNIGYNMLNAPEQTAELTHYIDRWRKNQSVILHNTLQPKDGLFNPACLTHTGFSSRGPLISGKSGIEAFNDWMFNGKNVRLLDHCGIKCGDHCPAGQNSLWLPGNWEVYYPAEADDTSSVNADDMDAARSEIVAAMEETIAD